MSTNTIFLLILSVVALGCTSSSRLNYDRSIFNTGGVVTGTQPEKSYNPYLLGKLYAKNHEIKLKMFDLINEAALRRDKRMQKQLDIYGKNADPTTSLAISHYKYVFGDTSQLDWLLKEDAKGELGRDSLILIVFGYMDEWDKTIRRFKEHDEVATGAGGETLHEAIEIREKIYGKEKFQAAWDRIQ